MAAEPSIAITVGGATYRVRVSGSEDELRALVEVVEAKLRELYPKSKPQLPQAFLLVALSLAHDLTEERGKRAELEVQTRDLLRRLLMRVDHAIEGLEREPGPGEGEGR